MRTESKTSSQDIDNLWNKIGARLKERSITSADIAKAIKETRCLKPENQKAIKRKRTLRKPMA
jgi:hypothetical protein